ncbi:TonB-dependent hemoglobin/transferrin/lactoferrin family receptor [Zwartia sp.]|uniref:TonB-dependent hemoglobin/transferrin/lactoferrin family receptor n=1 Tax=Zwartia sp. TaxID=2978004 RepID=UPI003BAE21EA
MLRIHHAGSPRARHLTPKRNLTSGFMTGLTCSITAGLYASLATAQAPEHTLTQLSEITVSASRGERRIDEVPASVTVISAETIEKEGARDLKDIFRNELDVTVPSGPTRFSNAGTSAGRSGNQGVNIRGLGGNQVLMLIDGIRVPNGFSFGSFNTGRGDYLDVDGIRSVEVLRGPASTQYGSDGVAGAVSFRTLDPADLYKKEKKQGDVGDKVGVGGAGGFVRTGYASIDRSWSSTLGLAGERGPWQGMILGSFRLGHEAINQGTNKAQNIDRTVPNPVDYNNRYLLAKAMLSINVHQQLVLTLESQRRTQATDVFSARVAQPLRPLGTLSFSTLDRINRDRLSLEHRYSDMSAAFIQKAETRVYWQDAQINQFATEERYRARGRTRDNTYQTTVFGAATQFESNITNFLDQRLTYGLDWSQANIQGVRDGTFPPYGGVFPDKPFPDTTYTLSGAFLQSEVELGDFSITPGLRFDYYRIAPSTNFSGPHTQKGRHNNPPATTDGYALTPRIGIVWSMHPMFAPYAQYAQGFRAPTPDQVNNGFRNLASGYTSIGNPDLKPEYADSFEIGVRGFDQKVSYSLSVFDNYYKNFISQQIVGGAGRPSNPTVYQYVNLTNAHIQGLVARADWRFEKNWSLESGFAYMKGDSTIRGHKQPLDSIQPFKILFGLRYDQAEWGARADWIWNAAKSPSQIAQSSPEQYATPSYGTLDLGFYWKPAPNFTLNANVNNVFDTKYWRWSDVSGLSSHSAIKDAYTAPGRNIQLSLRFDF